MPAGYRILHVSDLHWDSETAEDQRLVIRKFQDDLKSLAKDRKIDALVFSGDLVKRGQDAAAFLIAKSELLDPLEDIVGLTSNDILICPGNHDDDRELALGQK